MVECWGIMFRESSIRGISRLVSYIGSVLLWLARYTSNRYDICGGPRFGVPCLVFFLPLFSIVSRVSSFKKFFYLYLNEVL